MKFDPTLYLVTDSTGRTDDDFLSILEKALTGGVTLVQLREKERGGGEYLRLARLTKAVCDRYRVPLIIDDRADIGQSDLPVCEARKLLGEDKIVGATAKTVEQAQKAYREGADYLGTGAIFPTTTKVKTVLTPVSRLNDVCRSVPIPVVAIGGLNAGNMDVLNGSPIDGIAVVSAIMKSADPEAAARELFARVRVIKENNR